MVDTVQDVNQVLHNLASGWAWVAAAGVYSRSGGSSAVEPRPATPCEALSAADAAVDRGDGGCFSSERRPRGGWGCLWS
jgi:hypothetical protein